MKSSLIGNRQIPAFNELIESSLAMTLSDENGYDMQIAIENDDGEIYRIIHTSGLHEYLETVETMGNLGFEDILESDEPENNQFDAHFRFLGDTEI